MSARMPPEFMNEMTAGAPLAAGHVGPEVAHTCASAMMSPSDDSPAVFWVRLNGDGALPMTRFSVGAAIVPYLLMIAVMSGAAGSTFRRTITLLIVALTTSFVARLTTRSVSVTRRPTEAAPVSRMPVPAKFGQLTAQLVWPVMTRSISWSRRVMMSVIAVPPTPSHALMLVAV